MNHKILILIAIAAVCPKCKASDGPVSITFRIPSNETVVTTTTNAKPSSLTGRFWTEWIVETNDAPRVAMDGFNSFPNPLRDMTNSANVFIFNGIFATNGYYCDKEHLDRSEQTVTKYVSSNLVSFLVWRGQTNRNYLESIPVTNIVHHWHWDKKQVWTN